MTGEQVDIQLYNQDYEPIKNVLIIWAATAWMDQQTGEMFILDFFQVLWYSEKMPQSLINPNQVRAFRLPLCDDPTDHHHDFGIELSTQTVLPFKMEGTTVYFDTHIPSDEELRECQCITMMSDDVWDPTTVTLTSVRKSRDQEFLLEDVLSVPYHSSFEAGLMASISDIYDNQHFATRIISSVNVSIVLKKRMEPLVPQQSQNQVISFFGAHN